MLQAIDNLPASVLGVRATGKVSKADYEQVVLPALDEARQQGRRVRFLYHLGPEFEGFTAGAAWADLRVGVRYLRLFERCAVVTDVEWIRTATHAMAPVLPCPVKVFRNGEWTAALAWVAAPLESSLRYRMLSDRGVLLIEPSGRLRSEDFDVLAASVDTWIESNETPLDGIVIHTRAFPGWDNLGSVIRHFSFIRDHHRRIRRIAIATDTPVAGTAASLADHFVEAKIKRYDYEDLEGAIAWAAGRGDAEPVTHEPRAAQTS